MMAEDVGDMLQKMRDVKWANHLGRIPGKLHGLSLENGVFDHDVNARIPQIPFHTDHQEAIAATADDESMNPIVNEDDTMFFIPFDGTLITGAVYLVYYDDMFLIRKFSNQTKDLVIFVPSNLADFSPITCPESDVEIIGRMVFSTRSHE